MDTGSQLDSIHSEYKAGDANSKILFYDIKPRYSVGRGKYSDLLALTPYNLIIIERKELSSSTNIFARSLELAGSHLPCLLTKGSVHGTKREVPIAA